MQDDPTPAELVKAVADFLRNDMRQVIRATPRSSCASRSTRSIW